MINNSRRSLFFHRIAQDRRRATGTSAVAAAAIALLAAPGAGANSNPGSQGKDVQLRVLSSPVQWVSGGDARIEVRAAPGLHDKLQIFVNGSRVNVPLTATGSHQLEGVVRGFRDGDNTLEVYVKGQSLRDTVEVTNWPITGPMFTGTHQAPFVCTTVQNGVARQPLVDSATPPGYRVTNASGQTIGYSRNCSIDTFVSYWYRRNTGGSLVPLPAGPRPADMGTATLADGRTVDFIVRREVGSINRFLYSMAMLSPAPAADNAAKDDDDGRLQQAEKGARRRLEFAFQKVRAAVHHGGHVARRFSALHHVGQYRREGAGLAHGGR